MSVLADRVIDDVSFAGESFGGDNGDGNSALKTISIPDADWALGGKLVVNSSDTNPSYDMNTFLMVMTDSDPPIISDATWQ